VEELPKDNYYGFELDNNHRYVLGNFIVSHNTSIIKAIANECNRHIINVNLANIQTNTQLKNLFYNKSLQCKDEFQNVTFDIGIDERLYVIEDIDCMSEVVLDRKMSTEINDLDDNDLI
jgi:hypothetical protein